MSAIAAVRANSEVVMFLPKQVAPVNDAVDYPAHIIPVEAGMTLLLTDAAYDRALYLPT